MTKPNKMKLGVLTSGGDAQGMNAAVRAVARSAINRGIDVYAIHEGYEGMVAGDIRPLAWGDVGGILQAGGTVIGSARSQEFRTRDGRRKAALNLVQHGITGLVVIGGDGSLTGANIFRQEWPELLAELVEAGDLSQDSAEMYPRLLLVGMVGSIDNDMFGTDMTIGADSALHRIVEAVDAISSTAASHQRSFVIEVMGRHCGYLTLMAGLATGASWILIPEYPPQVDDWEGAMCAALQRGRARGRRHNIVLVAEGAKDRYGNDIDSNYVKSVLTDRLNEDTRVTILGHVQRGGTPSAFDRNMSTQLGHAAVTELLAMDANSEPKLIGLRNNSVVASPLMEMVAKTHSVADLIAAGKYEEAMQVRGSSFVESWNTLKTLLRSHPRQSESEKGPMRIGIMHSGDPAPGMNTAVRVAVRLIRDSGHNPVAIQNGFMGLIQGELHEMGWMDVHGWVARGGAELGTNKFMPSASDYYAMARQLEEHRIDALLVIGGWEAYETSYEISRRRGDFPAFDIPIACLPATINNDLPEAEHSVGADSALNVIMTDVDRVKETAVASRRVFVVEVMGNDCGFLALMSGIATGAERVYLPEEGITLEDLQEDVADLVEGFKQGKRVGLMIRNENADSLYTTDFLCALFEKEGGALFDVRHVILGHVQQGGKPSPFDRIQATRLAAKAVEYLIAAVDSEENPVVAIGRHEGHLEFASLEDFPHLVERDAQRPKSQWWLALRELEKIMAQPAPHTDA